MANIINKSERAGALIILRSRDGNNGNLSILYLLILPLSRLTICFSWDLIIIFTCQLIKLDCLSPLLGPPGCVLCKNGSAYAQQFSIMSSSMWIFCYLRILIQIRGSKYHISVCISWIVFISDNRLSDDISGIWTDIKLSWHIIRPSKTIYRHS